MNNKKENKEFNGDIFDKNTIRHCIIMYQIMSLNSYTTYSQCFNQCLALSKSIPLLKK